MEDYEEFGLGGEGGKKREGKERRGVLFFGFVKCVGILGGKILLGRCYANIYIYGWYGMLSYVLHYIYHVLANELPPR